ncbi:hypothetical protein I203_101384 [Kwoniella mangroviensis CBS 8507]|uniref:uncharacterized protein n=1 Tax=Kwoniella mangroviensis CBS 8507 TaxID=1296122 RepID=UPI00080D209E|nr:uncharacterized protein I203_03021 [Kwoniella mangroviensis CBS 8507]OCF68353.1 hypothetical protein I203_03021 [Kwoniella mangroviensis CBS 8507]
MSKNPTTLEAAALTNFTPAGQAALYHIHLAQQAEKDELAALEEAKKKEKKFREEIRPEEVKAGEVVDRWIEDWCPPLYQFLDIFASPHLTIGIFIFLHFAYWYTIPWYFHFLLAWPIVYFIPLYCTGKSTFKPKDRVLWLSYWIILSVLEYFEILLFRDQARSLVWWPKLKAIFCLVMYSIIDTEVILDSRGKPKDKKPIYGAIKLIEKFLPKEKDESKETKDRDKDKEREREKRSGSSKEKDRKEKEKDKKSKEEDKKKKSR